MFKFETRKHLRAEIALWKGAALDHYSEALGYKAAANGHKQRAERLAAEVIELRALLNDGEDGAGCYGECPEGNCTCDDAWYAYKEGL